MDKIKFAIVGCGLIGQKRLPTLAPEQLITACDLELSRAEALVKKMGHGKATTSIEEAIFNPAVDAVIIATINKDLAPLTLKALQAGKHVLVEKPAACSVKELTLVIAEAKKQKRCVRIGYNHRYHPALQKARQIVDSGELGPLLFIRGRYGHGGRVGYEKEWRANKELSGGGELIDQGVHLIDLSRWFLGDFPHVHGTASTFFWKMPVDDNAFMELKTQQGQVAWLHASCSEWKNMFSFEIYGRDGKLQVDGLGGSYGVERLSYYKMKPEMGPPDTIIYEYPGADTSWQLEMDEFIRDIEQGRASNPGLADAKAALEIVEKVYAQSGSTGKK
jgi:predicted dehydrogenase